MAERKKQRNRKRKEQRIFLGVLLGVLLAGSCVLMILAALKKGPVRGDASKADPAASEKSVPAEGDGGLLERVASSDDVKRGEGTDTGNEEDEATEPEEQGAVTLLFAGDILFDPNYATGAELANRGGSVESVFSKDLLDLMRGTDYCIVNNEFPYSERGTATEGKAFTFRAKPSSVSYLTEMGVDGVSLANNHAYDYGEDALLDTMAALEKEGIAFAGAGHDLSEASRPIVIELGGQKIAVFCATQIERLDTPDTRGAADGVPGVFRCWNPEQLLRVVAEAKGTYDRVIVFIHWGTESEEAPDWAQKDQAESIANAGADVIIGAHPHVLQGVTYAGENDDTPVIYSLGNFYFSSKTLDTALCEVTLTLGETPQIRMIPAIQGSCRTSLAAGAEKSRILSKITGLSEGAYLDENGLMIRTDS
ncbi:MAG: CapA family protein [Lachnospiraceae bacterium]|nr:CapA family protein [Lachnospiraceae bacterium]